MALICTRKQQTEGFQPRTQACSRYPSDQRRLGTERDRRIFPTSLKGDVTSEIAKYDRERGWKDSGCCRKSSASCNHPFHHPPIPVVPTDHYTAFPVSHPSQTLLSSSKIPQKKTKQNKTKQGTVNGLMVTEHELTLKLASE